MRAVMALELGKVGLGTLPVPTPEAYEALVRMEACAICNSTDHKVIENEFHPGPFPSVLGHEVISTVVEVGPKVQNFQVGDRVFRQRLDERHLPPGTRSNWGGFAEYGIVTDRWAQEGVPYGPTSLPHDQQKLLLDVSPALAAGMVTLMETLDAAVHTCITAVTSVAVVGSGPVAQAFATFAKLLGAAPVYAFGRTSRYAERFARVVGCDGYVMGTEYPREVERIIADGGFDIVIEAVGSLEALHSSLALAGARGLVHVYGIAPESLPFAPAERRLPQVRTLGAVEGRAQAQLVDFINAGALRLEDWVSHVFPLDECVRAFAMVKQHECLKAVLVP